MQVANTMSHNTFSNNTSWQLSNHINNPDICLKHKMATDEPEVEERFINNVDETSRR